MRNQLYYMLAVSTAFSLQAFPGQAADYSVPQDNNSNLLSLSLKQLSDTEVTSVSKKAEKASQAAAAIYVITQEDIRRSGLQSVPELLRMVPGLQVARSGSQNWAITSRGFDGQFANKLLVLIDGRSVYGAAFSGVFWDVQNLLIEDIDRIEVIRGPGATLWGANAVNGVINIISKPAKDTQGTLLTAAAGNQERIKTAARYGGTQGDLSYRTYAQYLNDAQEHNVSNSFSGAQAGRGADDQWHNEQGGFRLDWDTSDKEQKTLQGDAYSGLENAQRFLPVTAAVSPTYLRMVDDTDEVSGANILGRWKHELSAGSDVTLQGYYDDINRHFDTVGSSLHTQMFDLDFQHNLALGSRNDLTWGVGYRFINSAFGNGFYLSFQPENFYENLYSGFVQDKFALVPDKVFFTVGTKLEHNDFSGLEYEPSARLSWLPTENQTVWAAVSRAVRAPTQGDQNANVKLASLPTPAPFNALLPSTLVAEQGSGSARSEDVTSYELGYRIQPNENLSFDLTGYVNEYTNLASFGAGTPSIGFDPSMGAYFYQPEINQNANSGETHGFEAAATWEATKHVKFSGSYTLYYTKLHIVGASLVTSEGTSPKQQFNLRSYVDLSNDIQWDTLLYYVDNLPGVSDGFGNTVSIPAYTRLDMRLGWSPVKGVDLSLIGQNLLQSEHKEFSPFLYQTQEEIGRSAIAKATLRF